MKRRMIYWLMIAFVFSVGTVFGQRVNDSRRAMIGALRVTSTNDQGNLIYEVMVNDFERAGEWSSFIPRDYGLTMAMRREGGPRDEYNEEKNRYVLGVKTEFMKRDWSWITISPSKPIKIKGITKSLKVWVVGRNYKHRLSFVLQDFIGNEKYIIPTHPAGFQGKLVWTGWKRVELNMPLPPAVMQQDLKVSEERGITFVGFRIDFDPSDINTRRPFYVYFDYLTADIDLFDETHADNDDMLDSW